jgi:CRP-like cAMP-binding protein
MTPITHSKTEASRRSNRIGALQSLQTPEQKAPAAVPRERILASSLPRLFSGISPTDISRISAAARRRAVYAGQILAVAGDTANEMFLLRHGYVDYSITTEKGDQILLRRLVPNNVFGVAAMLASAVAYVGTSECVVSGEALVWDRHTVRTLVASYPLLAENALQIALGYLALFTQRHAELLANSAKDRLARALIRLGSRTGHFVPSGLEIEVKHKDLASLADTTIYTTSRVLSQWERKGLLRQERGRVILSDPERLLVT